ncbi:VOC family protein [Pedobacter sp. Du54]|uniref:VOC family protein n=1 Tax=Pedobacter anseongensis TaxID=3133439 RepID=UPI0030B74054
MNIPQNHQGLMPYLMLDEPEKFIDFVEKIFNATISAKHLTPDGKIQHCEATINGSTIMFSSTNMDWKAETANLFVYVNDVDTTYEKAIANGAISIMGISNQSYGRTCGVKDPCGNVWWITTV